MFFRYLILGFYLLFFSSVFGNTGNQGQSSDIHPVMYEFSKTIIGIRKELPAGNSHLLLPYVSAMYQASKDLNEVYPQKNNEIDYVFDRYRAEIQKLISELLDQVKSEDLSQVPLLMGEIRNTCVTCHSKFREDNDETGTFPSIGNVITGEVKITKLDGRERIDRSNIVVFLDYVSSNSPHASPRQRPVISQKDRQFEPRVIPITKGTTIDLPNDDVIFHNVFSLSRAKPFDLDIYPPGNVRSVTFDKTGWVKIYCNIHPQMISHVIILDNPFFDLTDEKGLFTISDVPDGKYTIRIWHEYGSEVRKEIQLSGSTLSFITFDIHEDKKFIQHKTKFGKPYRGKY